MNRTIYNNVVVDLDRTLLTSKGYLTDYTIHVFNKMRKIGVNIIIATGRRLNDCEHFFRSLSLSGPQILCDGSFVIKWPGKEIIQKINFDSDLLLKMLSLLNQFDITVLYSDGVVSYTNHYVEDDISYLISYGDSRPMTVKDKYILSKPIVQIIVIGKTIPSAFDNAAKLVLKKFGNQIELLHSSPFYFELVVKNTCKGNALKKICESTGIELKKTIGFGDSENDLSFLNIVGLPITVENASEKVKEKNFLITDSCDANGVAKKLEELFIQNK